ncbi:unnamed protein product [Dovyalis caffra]|uniref:Uncharacterized protein n=1 Tax=Dovyalis caffra TaxID=77055 RepID=A0AAV1SJZ9_9ROSI|nr:unnamed protein product [Dovyalis caffra]
MEAMVFWNFHLRGSFVSIGDVQSMPRANLICQFMHLAANVKQGVASTRTTRRKEETVEQLKLKKAKNTCKQLRVWRCLAEGHPVLLSFSGPVQGVGTTGCSWAKASFEYGDQ